MAETFELWFLGRTATLRVNATLSQLAHRTGYWYHQINHNGHPQEYAISKAHGPGTRDWEVHAVMSSDLPEEVGKAIRWLDAREIAGDPLVRMLIAPAYHLTAFWLEAADRNNVLVIACPAWFSRLQKEQLYDEREFLSLLAQEQPAQATPRRATQFSAPPNIPTSPPFASKS